jgi:adenylate kinase
MRIIIFGPQGSGKGTQAAILSKKYNIPHISTGDIFRELTASGTAEGKKVADLINNGLLVPDELTNKIVEERLKKADVKQGYILDGYPRNLDQADYLDKHQQIGYVFEIWISDEESVRRISNRRTCLKCRSVYHTLFKPPKKEGVCDNCGAELKIRDDDRPDATRKRLATYHEETERLITYYQKKGIYYNIDGEKSISAVTMEIEKIIDKGINT